MKRVLLAAALLLSVSGADARGPHKAWQAQLTNTPAIYFLPSPSTNPAQINPDEIYRLEEGDNKVPSSAAYNDLAEHVYSLEQRLADIQLKNLQHIEELERKVAGMQKQITILHAKKADKGELQRTRDQAAHIFRMRNKK